MIFDPFESRLCRDIRNTTGHEFIRALHKRSNTVFASPDPGRLPKEIAPEITAYIQHRQTCLDRILKQIKTQSTDKNCFYDIAAILWNHHLYFEVHEWLENKWITVKKDQKKGIQALILSAIAYEHFTYNRKAPAQKVAAKAIVLLKKYRAAIPKPFDPDRLVKALDLGQIPLFP